MIDVRRATGTRPLCAALILAASCTGRAAPTPTPTPSPDGDRPMIDEIRQLTEFLSTDPLRADDVAQRIGTLEEDGGPGIGIRVHPSSARFALAVISYDAATRAPLLVDLQLAADQKLAVGELRRAFGDYKQMRTDLEEPPQLVFRVDPAGKPYRAALVVRLDRPSVVTDESRAARITLRRDQRL